MVIRKLDEMVHFNKDGVGERVINNSRISNKELWLAIPAGSNKAQIQAIQESIDYARKRNIKIIVKEIK